MRLGWALVAVVCACSPPPCYPVAASRQNYSSYQVPVTSSSPRYGFAVADQNHELDLARLDRAVTETLACTRRVWPTLTDADRARAWCSGAPALEIRQCLLVTVAPDWYVSPCSGNQIFRCSVPEASCLAKGQVPTPTCPCSCRAIIQDQGIVTAPNLELFPARLTELLTGCDQIWGTALAACGSPELAR